MGSGLVNYIELNTHLILFNRSREYEKHLSTESKEWRYAWCPNDTALKHKNRMQTPARIFCKWLYQFCPARRKNYLIILHVFDNIKPEFSTLSEPHGKVTELIMNSVQWIQNIFWHVVRIHLPLSVDRFTKPHVSYARRNNSSLCPVLMHTILLAIAVLSSKPTHRAFNQDNLQFNFYLST